MGMEGLRTQDQGEALHTNQDTTGLMLFQMKLPGGAQPLASATLATLLIRALTVLLCSLLPAPPPAVYQVTVICEGCADFWGATDKYSQSWKTQTAQ